MNTTIPRHVAIILAAGASRRLGFSKQLLKIDGESLVRRATRAALATSPVRTLIVVGNDADNVLAVIEDLAVEHVNCGDWMEGMGASLRAALSSLSNEECDGALVVLCDQPALTAMHLQTLVSTWHGSPERAVASAYANTRGVPAILPRAWFADLQQLRGDRGARELLRSRADDVLAVAAPELARDIDTRQDLLSR